MSSIRRLRIRTLFTVLVAALIGTLTLSGAAFSAAPEARHGQSPPASLPTIVLVHGAFADSSGWNAVTSRLSRQGYPVIAFSNPLRGPIADGEYLRQFLDHHRGAGRAGRALVRRSGDHQRRHRQPTSSPSSTSPPTHPTRGRASQRRTRSAADTPTSRTTWCSGRSPAPPRATRTPTSTRPTSTDSSPRTSRAGPPKSWLPHSARERSRHWWHRRGHPRGRASRAGTSSPSRTASSRLKRNAPWQPAPARPP